MEYATTYELNTVKEQPSDSKNGSLSYVESINDTTTHRGSLKPSNHQSEVNHRVSSKIGIPDTLTMNDEGLTTEPLLRESLSVKPSMLAKKFKSAYNKIKLFK